MWTRQLAQQITIDVKDFLKQVSHYWKTFDARPEDILQKLIASHDELRHLKALIQDITGLVKLVFLFDRKNVGLRLTILAKAMCPRFYVDRVPYRLICAYQVVTSQWLPHDIVDRSK